MSAHGFEITLEVGSERRVLDVVNRTVKAFLFTV